MHDQLYISFINILSKTNLYFKIVSLIPYNKSNRIKNIVSTNQWINYSEKKYLIFKKRNNRIANRIFYVLNSVINIMILKFFLLSTNKQKDLFIIELTRLTTFKYSFNFASFNNVILTIHSTKRFEFDNKSKKSYRQWVYDYSNIICVLNNSLTDNLYLENKKSYIAPGSFKSESIISSREGFLKENLKSKSNVFRFTVTGTVSQNIKDYNRIIDVFAKLNKKNYELVFLGKILDQTIIDYALSKKVNVTFFDSYVNDEDFTRILLESHFLLYCTSNIEFNGYRTSGIIFDSFRFCVPLISDNHYLSWEHIKILFTNKMDNIINNLLLMSKDDYYKTYGIVSLEKTIGFNEYVYVDNLQKLLIED